MQLKLYVKKKKPFEEAAKDSWIERLQAGESSVPYGIAITFGTAIAFLQLGYLNPATWQLFLTGS